MEKPDPKRKNGEVPGAAFPPRSVLDCNHLFVPEVYRDRGRNRVLLCPKCHAIYEFTKEGRRLRYLGMKPRTAQSAWSLQKPKGND